MAGQPPGVLGADSDQLDALAETFARSAEKLRATQWAIAALIRTMPWRGAKADAFTGSWSAGGGANLGKASGDLDCMAAVLRDQANQQRGASASSGVGTLIGLTAIGAAGAGLLRGLGAVAGSKAPRQDLATILAKYQVADDTMVMWEPGFPASLLTDPTRITKTEAGLLDSLSLLKQRDFKDIHDDAFKQAEKQFPGTTPAERNDGHQDAFRHAYWNARLTRTLGSDFARKFATAHEGIPGNPGSREAMDLYNNEVGRQIALEHPDVSDAEMSVLIRDAVNRGDMVVIDKSGRLAFSDQVPFGEHGQASDPPRGGGQPAEQATSGDAWRGTGS